MKNKIDKFIVITTINQPSEAIKIFCEWSDWHVVVVGDRKTPADWNCEGVTFLSIEDQYDLFGELARVIPENTYTRKMLGYLYAIRQGATAILESDDDNIPYVHAQDIVVKYLNDPFRTAGQRIRGENNWLNIYSLFGETKCWPRGFPIELLGGISIDKLAGYDNTQWGLIQFLADEDPDVDAIYRMVKNDPVYFAADQHFIVDRGSFCPINSQATLWIPETFPLMFLPIGVFDRVTDILRGYITTTAMWAMGLSALYASPIVYQKRNIHNLHNDFLQELPLYINSAHWCCQLMEIKSSNPVDFYRAAILMLEANNVFSVDNKIAYDLFLKTAKII